MTHLEALRHEALEVVTVLKMQMMRMTVLGDHARTVRVLPQRPEAVVP